MLRSRTRIETAAAWPRLPGSTNAVIPRLSRLRAVGNTLTFCIRAGVGHTVDELTAAAKAIATSLGRGVGETHLGRPWDSRTRALSNAGVSTHQSPDTPGDSGKTAEAFARPSPE